MDVFANPYVIIGIFMLLVGVGPFSTLSISFVTDRFKTIWLWAYLIILLSVTYLTEALDPMSKAFREGELLYSYAFAVGAMISALVMSYLVALLLTIVLRVHKAIDKED